MNTTAQAMTPDQIIDMLDANGIDNYTRDLGRSGGGDWWAIEVPAAGDRFILITSFDSPFDANVPDYADELLCVQLYAGGEYEDEGDRPWTSFGTDDTPATHDAILAAIAAARTFSESWDGGSE